MCPDTRNSWHSVVQEINHPTIVDLEVEVFLYKSVTLFFLKIQPKKLLKQYSLGPNKRSLALRHGLSAKNCSSQKLKSDRKCDHTTTSIDPNVQQIKDNLMKPEVPYSYKF